MSTVSFHVLQFAIPVLVIGFYGLSNCISDCYCFQNMSNKCPLPEYKHTRCTSWSFRRWYSWCLPCLHAGRMQHCSENVFQAFTNLEVHRWSTKIEVRVTNQCWSSIDQEESPISFLAVHRCSNQLSSWTKKQFMCPPPEQVSPAKPTPGKPPLPQLLRGKVHIT